MMSNIKHKSPESVEVKIEVTLDYKCLLTTEIYKCTEGDGIDSTVNDYSSIKVKKEVEYSDNEELETETVKQISASYFKCKEEIKDEGEPKIYNKFKTENQESGQEFSENNDLDEKIDISEILLQSNEYKYKMVKIEIENDSENPKAVDIQRNSPVDDRLKQHIKQQIRSKKVEINNCQFCNIYFMEKISLDDHMLKHHKQEIKSDLKNFITSKIYKCNMCKSYETTKTSDIVRHVNIVHEKGKFKNCQFCEKSFVSRQSLDTHVLRKHKDKIQNNVNSFIKDRIQVCKLCNSYETTLTYALKQHYKQVHNVAKFKEKFSFRNGIIRAKNSDGQTRCKKAKR